MQKLLVNAALAAMALASTAAVSFASATTASNASVAPSVAPTTASLVQLPQAVMGEWHTFFPDDKKMQAQFGADKDNCYTKAVINETAAEWTTLCNSSTLGQEAAVYQFSMNAAQVVACGMSFQIGMANGVFGGLASYSDLTTGLTTENVNLCVSFYRVAGQNIGQGQEVAQTQFVAWEQKQNASIAGYQCQFPGPQPPVSVFPFSLIESAPAGSLEPNRVVNARQISAVCNNGMCLTTRYSACAASGHTTTRDIGIGMSVGGVGVIVTTFICIIIIAHVFEKA